MGFDLGKFLQVLEAVAPVLLAVSGVPPALIPAVIHGISIAESRPLSNALSSSEKKAIALDAVSTAIVGINAVKPAAIDPDIVKVVDEAIDTVVGTVNAVRCHRNSLV